MRFKTFCIGSEIEYQEIKAKDVVFNKFYSIENPNHHQIIGIPDGCLDIQCVLKGKELSIHICGSYTQSGIAGVGNFDQCFGAKFNPGIIADCFNGRIHEIVNKRCDLKDFMELDGIEQLMENNVPMEMKAEFFMNRFKSKDISEQHEIITYLIQNLVQNHGYIQVSELIRVIGYSHRYTDRVFKNYLGFSIKKYANILRLQEAIDIVHEKKQDLVYDKLGYYDQSHFIHDFKKFTSLTPCEFSRMSGEKISIV